MRKRLNRLLLAGVLAVTGIGAATAGAMAEPAAEPSKAAAAPPPIYKLLAPFVYLADGEKNPPVYAELFLQHSSLKWSHTRCRDDGLAAEGRVNWGSLGKGSYRHQKKSGFPSCNHGGAYYASNQPVRPHEMGGRDGMFLDLNNARRGVGGTTAPVYFEYVPKHYITYWMFYPYNNGPTKQNHEGDWERITIRLNIYNRPARVAYFGHGGHCIRLWEDAPKYHGHPIVFSARGTHASYPRAGKFPTKFGFHDTTSAGPVWPTWPKAYNAKTRPWYGFGGAWGEVGEFKDTTGPSGPGVKNPLPSNWYGPACA